MDLPQLPEILGELRARLHQRVDFEVRDVERRLRDELSGLAADARRVAAGVAATEGSPKAAPQEALQAAVEGGDPGSPSHGDLDNDNSSNELRVSMMFTQEPSKDEFKAMVQRQNSYAYAWATGSRVRYNQRFRSEQISINSLVKAQSESCMKRIVQLGLSPYFDVFWALIITSNAAFLGFQLTFLRGVNLMSVQVIYAVLFAIELILRLLALGPRDYFFAPGFGWNWLDAVVVTSSWVNIIIELLGSSGDTGVSSSIRVLRLLRVSRLLRIVKTLWIVRFVGALRTLVASLVDTFKPLFWAMLLLLIIIYIAGILFTEVAMEHLTQREDPNMERFFGTLGTSTQTLFRSISGGFDWAQAADSLEPLGMFWVMLFQFYIGFCTFAVLNIMTGFFCESAIKSAQQDHQNTMDNRQEFRDVLANIFQRLDDGDGQLTLAEFEKMFENEHMQAFLETAEITASDAWTLFASLDVDGDHVIDVDEFTKRCLSLRGGARSMDVFALTRHNLKIREQLTTVQQQLAQLAACVMPVKEADVVSM